MRRHLGNSNAPCDLHIGASERCCGLVDYGRPAQVRMMQCAIAKAIDDARDTTGRLEDDIERFARKPYAFGRAARDAKPVRNVAL